MNKIIILMAVFIFTLMVDKASAEFQVPVVKKTNQWKIELLDPPADRELSASQKGKFDTYNLNVTNMGEKVYHVRVEAFRNETGTNTMFGLAPQMTDDELEASENLQFSNFPIKVDSKKLEIVVTWEGKPNTFKNGDTYPGRKYKETFLITP